MAVFFCFSFEFLVYVVLCLIVFGCQYQCNWLPGKTRLRNNLLCVEWDVKPYTLTLSPNSIIWYWPIMLCSWGGNRSSGVTLAMHLRTDLVVYAATCSWLNEARWVSCLGCCRGVWHNLSLPAQSKLLFYWCVSICVSVCLSVQLSKNCWSENYITLCYD